MTAYLNLHVHARVCACVHVHDCDCACLSYPSDARRRHFVLLEDAIVVVLDVVRAVVPVAGYDTRIPHTFLLEVALHPVSFLVHNLTSRCCSCIGRRRPHSRWLGVRPNTSTSTNASTRTCPCPCHRYRSRTTAIGAVGNADRTRSLHMSTR
jgi:hypothetical protein